MSGPSQYEKYLQKLRETSYRGQLHGGVQGASVDRGGKPTPEHLDDSMWSDKARFVDTPRGQMEMRVEDDDVPWHLPETIRNEDGVFQYAEEHQPYATRPKDDGSKQLPLGRGDAFRPTDPALHNLRMSNPHLNDYHFQVQGAHPSQIHTVTAIHTPTGHQAGSLSWKGKEFAEKHHPGEGRAGEVEMVSVYDQHRGMGLSTAMWDYAHFHASRDGSQIAHPVHSDNRSVEGNHWAHFVGGASMARTKGFNVKEY